MIERGIAESVASSTPPKAVAIFGPRRENCVRCFIFIREGKRQT